MVKSYGGTSPRNWILQSRSDGFPNMGNILMEIDSMFVVS